MKATKLLPAAAFGGLVSLSFAGSGPEYWARMNATNKNASNPIIRWNKTSAEAIVKAALPTPKPATGDTATCAPCGCTAKKV